MGLVSLRVAYSSGNSYYCYLVVQPEEYDTVNEFVYLELVEGDSTDLTAEYIESVVVMDSCGNNRSQIGSHREWIFAAAHI